MAHRRTDRVQTLTGIGVDRLGDLATKALQEGLDQATILRLENLDTDVLPDSIVSEITSQAVYNKQDNSYLPFVGQLGLRDAAATHVTRMIGDVVHYSGDKNCVITAGGLSGVLNVLFATVNQGEGVLMMDPTYSGLINRVKLVGAVPVFFPLDFHPGDLWTIDHSKLRQRIQNTNVKITAMLLTSPNLPSGFVLEQRDLDLIAELCIKHDLILIWDTAFERLLFDGRQVLHPASLPGMADRTVVVGSASKELRMIGWRVGYIVGPEWLMSDIALVGMANVVVPVGVAAKAAKAALENSYETLPLFTKELEARRDLLMEELEGLPVGIPSGGWSFVVRVDSLGFTGKEASEALVRQGIFVTPMDGWGEEHGSQYFRIVFSNEPREKLRGIGARIRAALNLDT